MPLSRSRRNWLIASVAVVLLGSAAVVGRIIWLPATKASADNPAVVRNVDEAPANPIPEPAPAIEPLSKLSTHIVYLEPADPIVLTMDGRTFNTLSRELVRQAFLLAARDGMQLSTRDAAIGEDPPPGLPSENRLSLEPGLIVGKPANVAIGRGPFLTRQVLWLEPGPTAMTEFGDPLKVTVAAEKLSREGFVNALRRIGFTGSAVQSGNASVPEGVESMLADPCFIAQFTAVRKLHEIIRSVGESRGLVGALARGYANLGLLTELHWGTACKSFQARGLLYAQRLFAGEPNSPWGLWHRAYAAALAGAHSSALSDLAIANRMTAPPEGPPGWIGVVESLCYFDTAKLGLPQANAKLAPWAAVFRFLTSESPESVQLSAEMAAHALKLAPDCSRIHDGLAEIGGKAHRRKVTKESLSTFGEMLHRRLTACLDVPQDAAALLKTSGEPAVMAALVAAGQARDAGELTWAVPARLAEDARFAQIVTRVEFLRDIGRQPTFDELKTYRPLVLNHPHLAFLDTFGLDPIKDSKRIAATMINLGLKEVHARQRAMYRVVARIGDEQRQWAWRLIGTTTDQTYRDQYAMFQLAGPFNSPAGIAEHMARVSNFAPLARTAYVEYHWPTAEPLAATWEAEAQNPALLTALGRKHTSRQEWEKAEQCFKRAIALSADASTYEALADLYEAQGKRAEWLGVLETLLMRTDADPFMARRGVTVADHFLRNGEVERARPFAEAAAEAESDLGEYRAIECAERLGDWVAAERWAKKASERRADRIGLWFFWCHKTGRGDLNAATATLEKWQTRPDAEPTVLDYRHAADRHFFAGRYGECAELIETALRMSESPPTRLLAGLMYDAAGRNADRDRCLATIPHENPFGKLSWLFREALHEPEANGKLDIGKADRVIANLPPEQIWIALYAVGRFHMNRHNATRARSYFEQVVKNRDELYAAGLAGHDLRLLSKLGEQNKNK